MGEDVLRAGTILWAAGVAASPLGRTLGVPLDRAGRVLVNPDLTIPGHPELFVIGDLAAHMQEGRLVTGLAPIAVQQGRHVARSIAAGARTPFVYADKGKLATIGRAAAVAELGDRRLSGWIAWWAWLLVHIFFLIGFRNRLVVLFSWAWVYWTYERGSRLITGDGESP